MKMVSTSDVLDRHLKSFAEHDVDSVVSDYSLDAVLFAPNGPLKGPDAIKPLFEALISEFAKPGSSFTMQLRCIKGDHAYILWTAETADNSLLDSVSVKWRVRGRFDRCFLPEGQGSVGAVDSAQLPRYKAKRLR